VQLRIDRRGDRSTLRIVGAPSAETLPLNQGSSSN
jgi:hypothetical protein